MGSFCLVLYHPKIHKYTVHVKEEEEGGGGKTLSL